MKKIGRKLLTILLALIVFVTSAPISMAAPVVSEGGTTYYISNSEGDNNNDGLSETTPWKDFTNVNSKVFEPGDQILLKRGDVWNQLFQPAGGNGTAEAPIVISTYGEGDRPVLAGSSSNHTMMIKNASWWTVRGLEFRNAQYGPFFDYTTVSHEGIVIEDNYIHDLYGGPNGIAVVVSCDYPDVDPGTDGWIAKDIKIQNNIIGPTQSYGIVVMNHDSRDQANAFQNVVVKNNYLRSVSAKAIVFQGTQESYWIGNYIDNAANAAQQGGTTASFLFRTKNMYISNNIFVNTPDTGSSDQSAIDNEGQNEDNHYTGNYFSNNYGGAMEFLMINGEIPPRYGEDYNRNHEIKGNTFVANNVGALWATTDTGPTSGSITDNLYYENNLLRDPSKFQQWTPVENNTEISDEEKIYNAGADYAAAANNRGWSYEKKNGTYTKLSYDESLQAWGDGDAYISRFIMNGGDGTVARTWTVPYDGTIAISGQAATGAEGDTADVCVTKNGTVISGTEQTVDSMSGVATNYRNIQVNAGDVLRFEVTGNDEVIWIPTVAYTEGGNSAEDAGAVPGTITDLKVIEQTHNRVVIEWTAPGRDGDEGTASKYDIRYSTEEITEENFEQAVRLTTAPFPAETGTTQRVEISQLTGNTTYYFVIKTYNDIPNTSAISNVVSGKTDADVTELQNTGFEEGMEFWVTQGCTAEIKYGDSHSGANAAYVSNRSDTWGSVAQDVTGVLKANGPGFYNFGAWARFENTSSRAFVIINYTDEQGNYWVTTHEGEGSSQGALISTTEYTEINGTRNISWIGELKQATIYFQTAGSTDSVYLDDFFLAPSESQIDRGSLSSAINSAKAIKGDEYTEVSYGNLVSLLEDAEAVMMKEDAAQDEVDRACNLLNAAISSLTKPSYQLNASLVNPGFEEGTEPWKNNPGTVQFNLITDKVHSGDQALFITGRTDSWHGALQTITDVLNAAGPGIYQFGTYAMYENQSSRAVVTLSWNDGKSSQFVTSHVYEDGGQGITVSNEEFTEVSGVREILWEGILTDASIYFQSMQGSGNTDNLILDDFFLVKINKTPLMTLYNQNKNREQEDVSDEKYEAFCETLEYAALVLGDAESTQESIDEARDRLERAVKSFGSDASDKTELNTLIEEAKALEEKAYTTSSYEDVLAKLNVTKAVRDDAYATQKGVNLAADGLRTALETLRKLADKNDLQALYDKVKDYKQDTIDELRWEAFTLALENASEVLKDSEANQARVDAARNSLQHVVDALKETPILELVNPGFEEGNADAADTSWTWPDWRSIVTDPALVHSGNNALHVTGRWAEYIGPQQDITALLKAGGPGLYDFGCWARFGTSDSTAQVVITLNGTQNILSKETQTTTTQYALVSDRQNITWDGELASATISFRSGNTNNDVYLDDFFLTKVEGADRTKLNALLEMYAFVTADAYTQDTYDAYVSARAAAEALSETVDQETVNLVAAQLETAAKALKQVEKQPTENGALLAAAQNAAGLNASEYTPETFAVVTAKNAVAEALLQDTYAVPDMVALALAELQEAVAQLVKSDDGNTDNPGGDGGNTDNPGGDNENTDNPGGDGGNTDNPGGDTGNSQKPDGTDDNRSEIPKTGTDDTVPMILWFAMLLSAGCAAVFIRKKMDKRWP